MASDHAIANGVMKGHGFSRAARNLKSAALAAGVLFRDTASEISKFDIEQFLQGEVVWHRNLPHVY